MDHMIFSKGSQDLKWWITWSLVRDHMIFSNGSHDLKWWITWSQVMDHIICSEGSHELRVCYEMKKKKEQHMIIKAGGWVVWWWQSTSNSSQKPLSLVPPVLQLPFVHLVTTSVSLVCLLLGATLNWKLNPKVFSVILCRLMILTSPIHNRAVNSLGSPTSKQAV